MHIGRWAAGAATLAGRKISPDVRCWCSLTIVREPVLTVLQEPSLLPDSCWSWLELLWSRRSGAEEDCATGTEAMPPIQPVKCGGVRPRTPLQMQHPDRPQQPFRQE